MSVENKNYFENILFLHYTLGKKSHENLEFI